MIQLLEANVSTQVAFQSRHFPLENGKNVTPYGRLPSSRDRTVDSKIYGKPVVSITRLITLLKA